MGDENPSNFRDELKRRRELRAAQMREATPVRLVGRYPAPVAVAAAVSPEPPSITLELPPAAAVPPAISGGAPPRKRGPNRWIIGLMLVPAVVALISTSLLLYVLLLERHPHLFAADESGEPGKSAEEPEQQHTGPRVAPRYGFAPSGQADRASGPRPEAQAQQPQPPAEPMAVPETAAIGIGVQPQQTAPANRPPPAPASSPQPPQASAPAPPAPPPAPPPAQTAQAPAPPPQAQPVAPPIQRVPPQLIAEWGDPGLQPVQTGAPSVPPDQVLLLLIRSSLLALHRSNMTGNYQFLRGISSLPFQNANPPGKLFQVFSNLRNRGVDLSPAMTVQPKLIAKPEINQRGVLRISGFFPTEPERIYFDLKFLRGPQGRWRLFGITVDKLAPKPKAEAAAAPAPAQPAPSQLAPTGAEANAAPDAAPPPQALPPLPSRKPTLSAATEPAAPAPEGEGAVGGNEEVTAGTTIEDVHERVDEADAQPPAEKKRFWPFRRRDSEE